MIKQPYSPMFLRLWQASPRRGSKRKAENAFLKLRVEEEDMDMLLEAMDWQVKEYIEEHPDDDKMKYFPHTSTWLNGEYYDKERPKKIDDCICGKANDGTHKYSIIDGRKVYKCTSCRGVNLRIAR